MKKTILLSILCMTAAALTSCSKPEESAEYQPIAEEKKQEKISSQEDAANMEIPDVYERESDNIVFKAAVSASDEAKSGYLSLPRIQLQLLEEERVVDEMMKNTSITEKKREELLGSDGKTSTAVYYTGNNQEILNVQSYRADYHTAFYRNYLAHAFDLERNAEKFSGDKELSFMSTKEAWGKVQLMLESMQIKLENPVYKYYALDSATLASEEYVIDMDGNIDKDAYKPSWTEEDEGYYFCIWQSYEGIKIHCPNIEFIDKYADFNAPIQVLVNPKEVSYLSLGRTFVIDSTGHKKELLDLDKISDTLIQKLSMIITDAKYTVDTMELCYYPYKIQDEEYEMTATWILDILEELPSGESSRFQMAIDAFTAEELFS